MENMIFRSRLATAAIALSIGMVPAAAGATELTLFPTWSNESEMAALNTIVKEFESRGNKITSVSVPHETAGESPLASLFVAGTPPNLFIAADAAFFRDLEKKNQAVDVRPLMDKIGATKAFPETVLKAITIDGKLLKIPTAV